MLEYNIFILLLVLIICCYNNASYAYHHYYYHYYTTSGSSGTYHGVVQASRTDKEDWIQTTHVWWCSIPRGVCIGWPWRWFVRWTWNGYSMGWGGFNCVCYRACCRRVSRIPHHITTMLYIWPQFYGFIVTWKFNPALELYIILPTAQKREN